MTLLQVHIIGLLNLWIFFIPYIMLGIIPLIFKKEVVKRMGEVSFYGSKEKMITGCKSVIFFGSVIYSIWVPLHVETIWFYIGLIIIIIGFILSLISYSSFISTPLDKLVVKGVYKISRNPHDLSSFFVLLGGCIVSLSWIILLITIIYAIFNHQLILSEERYLLETYGESYLKYKEKVPRYLLFF